MAFLIRSFAAARCVELWVTPCIVTLPPDGSETLVVPTNERLCGTQFAHFPVGGPTPQRRLIGERPGGNGERSATRLLYQCESVDGVVTELGGQALSALLGALPRLEDSCEHYPARCRVGSALHTRSVGALEPLFSRGLVHCVPPFWDEEDEDEASTRSLAWRREMLRTYASAFEAAAAVEARGLAVPLLGSGARGAPLAKAASAAASAAALWAQHQHQQTASSTSGHDAVLRFGILDHEIQSVHDALDTAFTRRPDQHDQRTS